MRSGRFQFLLRIVTASSDVGLRRLRAITAPLGGQTFVHTTVEECVREASADKSTPVVCAIDSACAKTLMGAHEMMSSQNQVAVNFGMFNLSGLNARQSVPQLRLPKLVFLLNDLGGPLLDNPFGKTALAATIKAWHKQDAIDASHFLNWAPFEKQMTHEAGAFQNLSRELRLSQIQTGQHQAVASHCGANWSTWRVLCDGVTLASTFVIRNPADHVSVSSSQMPSGGGLLVEAASHDGSRTINLLTRLAQSSRSGILVASVGDAEDESASDPFKKAG
jgi:hypothetical protein